MADDIDERIEYLTAKILKLSRQLFGAAEELMYLGKVSRISPPVSAQLLAAHAAIASVVNPSAERPPAPGGN